MAGYRKKESMEKRFKLFLVLTLTLSIVSLQDTMLIRSFKIESFTKKPLEPNNKQISPVSEIEYKGLIHLESQSELVKEFGMTLNLTFRTVSGQKFKNSTILALRFPYNYNSEFENKLVTYTPYNPKKEYRVAEDSIKFYQINPEFYLSKGKQILKQAKLNYIKSNIWYLGRPQFEYNQTLLKYLEVSYSIDGLHYRFVVEQSQFDRDFIPEGTPLLGIIISFFGFACFPLLQMCLLKSEEGKRPKTLKFFGQTLYQVAWPLTFCMTVKHGEAYFFLIPLVIIFFFNLISSMEEMKRTFKTTNLKLNGILEKSNNRLKKHVLIISLVTVFWFCLNIYSFRFVFRGFFYYFVLALVDLWFVHRSSPARKELALEIWFVSVSIVVANQFFLYLGYLSIFVSKYWEVPDSSIYLQFLVPDLVLVVLSLIAFMLVFRVDQSRAWRQVRGMDQIPRIASSGSVDVTFMQSPTWIENRKKELKMAKEKYEMKLFQNVPFNERKKTTQQRIFNLHSKNPLHSQDYLVAGEFRSKIRIRYVSGSKKTFKTYWDFVLEGLDNLLKVAFIESIWINNQRRRDLVAYVDLNTFKITLFSIKTRKVLSRLDFKASSRELIKYGKGVLSSADLVIQPAHGFRPILVRKIKNKLDFLVAKFKRIESHKIQFFGFEKPHSDDPLLADRCLSNGMESTYFDEYMATKYFYHDETDYERKFVNDCKYQTILVTRIDLSQKIAHQMERLNRITEGMFSSRKIDFFFFVDKKTLALVILDKIYLVDWKNVAITRCFDLKGLHSLLLNAGIKYTDIFTSYWYDRVRGMIHFALGVVSGGGQKDVKYFMTDIDKVSVNYLLSGEFRDDLILGNETESEIEEEKEIEQQKKPIDSSTRLLGEGMKQTGTQLVPRRLPPIDMNKILPKN